MARLVLPSVLRADAAGQGVVEVRGGTVREALDRLRTDLPRLERRIRDDRGALREHVQLFVDGDNIRDRDQQDTALGPGSEIHVVPAMSGGSGLSAPMR